MTALPPGPVDAHVGHRIRLRRLAIGMSQEKLAEALNLSFQQVQKYEKGHNRVGGARLAAVARALETGVGYFFEGAEGALVGDGAPSRSPMDEFLALREGVPLALAFVAIKNPRLRTALLAHARALATCSESAIVATLEAAAAANAEAANTAPMTATTAADIDRRST